MLATAILLDQQAAVQIGVFIDHAGAFHSRSWLKHQPWVF
jgi:hypothetical protein